MDDASTTLVLTHRRLTALPAHVLEPPLAASLRVLDVGFNLLGDALRDSLDPTERRR